MSTVIIGTILMMVATFVIGLAVSFLIRLISGILYYAETGSLLHDIAARRRLYHISRGRRSEAWKQLAVGHSENELINFYYGNKGRDNRLIDYYGSH